MYRMWRNGSALSFLSPSCLSCSSRQFSPSLLVPSLLSLVLLFCGCSSLAPRQMAFPDDAVRSRATNFFHSAALLKPIENAGLGQAFQFAPLILQEISENGPAITNAAPGSFNSPGAALYTESDTVTIRDRQHSRFTYLWFYGVGPGRKVSGTPRAQGIRITLDRHGKPAIWEVMSDSSGLRLIYVSAALEARAKAQFGVPLPERRHSIERSILEKPRTVVVRVLEDAGTPMGPIVYVSSRPERDIATVLCRCMPSQAGELVSTQNYELWPMIVARNAVSPEQWAALAAGRLSDNTSRAKRSPIEVTPSFWPGDSIAQDAVPTESLDTLLRLPTDF